MYLKERVLALLIYVLLLFLIMLLIKRIKGVNATLNLYVIVLSIMGYFYKPLEGADLTRVIIAMNSYKYLTISQLIENSKKSIAPLSSLYYYAIGQLNNDNLLPAITAFITFTFIFKIIKSHYSNYITSKKSIALALLFFMSRGLLLQTISNIRTMLSLSILSFCIYKILYEGKKIIIYLPLMLIASTIHVVGFASTILFFIFYFISYVKVLEFKKIVLVLLIFSAIIFFGKNNIIGSFELAKRYLESNRIGIGYFYVWEFVISFLVTFVTLILIHKYTKSNIRLLEYEREFRFIKFLKIISILDIIVLFVEFNMGFRLNYLITIFSIPMILYILNSTRISTKDRRSIEKFVVLFSTIILLLSCARGDLCGLKF